jgi:hypothetical protein
MKLIDKKKGIKAIEHLTGTRAVYFGSPTFAYEIGPYKVDRDGNVNGDDLDWLMTRLAEDGVDAEGIPKAGIRAVPMTPEGKRNLENMLHSKRYLLERVFGYKDFGMEESGGKVRIVGFPDTENYRILADAMIKASEASRWISPDETIEENEKFYMRAWLVRIGLGGQEFKELRKAILHNLRGHTAFRTLEDAEKWKGKWQ